MKTYDQVLARAKEHVAHELDRRFEEANKRLPHLCMFNHRQPLDTRKTVAGEPNPDFNTIQGPTIGLCMYGAEGEDWPGDVCEDPIDAQRCPLFKPMVDKSQILAKFEEDLSDHAWINLEMPALSELLWVLDRDSAPRLGWFYRFLNMLRKVKLEPVQVRKSTLAEILEEHYKCDSRF